MTNDIDSIEIETGKEMIEEYFGKKFKWQDIDNGIKTYLHATLIEIVKELP